MTLEHVPHHPGKDSWQAMAEEICPACGLERLPTADEIFCVILHELQGKGLSDEEIKTLAADDLRKYVRSLLELAQHLDSKISGRLPPLKPIEE